MIPTITMLYAGLLGLLLIVLSFRVVGFRRKTGNPGDPAKTEQHHRGREADQDAARQAGKRRSFRETGKRHTAFTGILM